MAGVKMIKLASGSMPQLGFGTWRSEPGKVKKAVEVAIAAGYRHIDAAWIYGNEAEVGAGIASSLKQHNLAREDLWVTSKLWNNFHDPKNVRGACEETLRSLKLDYLDLYLMHWPVAFQFPGFVSTTPKDKDGKVLIDEALTRDQSATWHEMERLVEAGLVRNIGVSNFCPARLDKLLSSPDLKIKPAVNQVELHPYNSQPKLLEYCKSKGIHLTAYSPLGSQGSDLLTDSHLTKLAESKGTDVGRLLIAWALERGTSVIPKSVTPSRIESNFGAKDVKLSPEEIKSIDDLNRDKRFVDPSGAWGVDIYCAESDTIAKL